MNSLNPPSRTAAAVRLHSVMGSAMPMSGTRALADGPTFGELLLEGLWGRDLRSPIRELYWRPITAGLTVMLEQSRDEIAQSVLGYYSERPDIVDPVKGTLKQYLRRGFNLGGQMGLDELALEGYFELSDDHIAGVLDDHVDELVQPATTRPSLTVTTADEIARHIDRRRAEGMTISDMLPAISAWVLGRTMIRSAAIAATESVWVTRRAMLWAFVGNGIHGVAHECALDVEARCSGACPALCGTEYELGGVFNPMRGIAHADLIPLHTRCRCWYSPLRDGWLKPALIWTGFALGMLGD